MARLWVVAAALLATGHGPLWPGSARVAAREFSYVTIRSPAARAGWSRPTVVVGCTPASFSAKGDPGTELPVLLASPLLGCNEPQSGGPGNGNAQMSSYTGFAVVVSRGQCSFEEKAARAIALGARALIVVNNEPGSCPQMGALRTLAGVYDPRDDIPSCMVKQKDMRLLQGESLTANFGAIKPYVRGFEGLAASITGITIASSGSNTRWTVPAGHASFNAPTKEFAARLHFVRLERHCFERSKCFDCLLQPFTNPSKIVGRIALIDETTSSSGSPCFMFVFEIVMAAENAGAKAVLFSSTANGVLELYVPYQVPVNLSIPALSIQREVALSLQESETDGVGESMCVSCSGRHHRGMIGCPVGACMCRDFSHFSGSILLKVGRRWRRTRHVVCGLPRYSDGPG
jgi:hypothetical protein